MIGKKHEFLTIIQEVERPLGAKVKEKYWLCKCICGTKKVLTTSTFKRMKSCGCYKKIAPTLRAKHGLRGTRFYNIWAKMKSRCYIESDSSYQNYGEKGIKVSGEWLDFISFMNDMYESYQDHVKKHGVKQTTLDIIDSTKDYCLSKCKWSTIEEQNGNRNTVVSFIATSPDGVVYKDSNYAQFAKNHNLNKTAIWLCLEGRNKTHKRWIFERCDAHEQQ